MAEPADVEAERFYSARFGLRGQVRVIDTAAVLYSQGRLGSRGMALGLFDATSGGIFFSSRMGLRGSAQVVSTLPAYFAGRIGSRGAAAVLSAEIEIPEGTPQPDRIYRPEGEIVLGGADEAEIVTGGALAAQIVTGGRNA